MFKNSLFNIRHFHVKNVNFSSKLRIAVCLLCIAIFTDLSAQVNFTGSSLIDFTGYEGAGFAPSPAADQLDSDNWAITGFSTGTLNYGGTQTGGDFAQGDTDGSGESTGGLYSLTISGNPSFWIQPGGSDFTPGTVTLRIANNTGSTMSRLDVAYDILFLNDQARGNSLNFSWSTDDITYTPVGALDFESPEVSDVLGVTTVDRSTTIQGFSVNNGDFIYLRWSGDDESGGGSRDEMGLDNISLSLPVWNVTNDPDTYYSTIQGAVDAATMGDEIQVAAGIFDESVLVNKSLTINGPNAVISAVDGSRVDEARLLDNLRISATEGVSINGFEFFEVDAGTTWPIYIQGNSNNFTINNNRFIDCTSTAIRSGISATTNNLTIEGNLVDGITDPLQSGMAFGGVGGTSSISNNKLNDLAYGGLLIDGADGLVISGNEISNAPQQGLQLAGNCKDVTVSGNTIMNTNTDEVADKGAIRLYGAAYTGAVTISGNTLSSSYNGVAVRDGQDLTGNQISIEDNNLDGNSNNGVYNGASMGEISATCNWWGDVNGPAPTYVTGSVLTVPYRTTSNLSVPVDCIGGLKVHNVTQGTYFATIQEAIDDGTTMNGDEIEVGEGTYAENVVVNKELSISAVVGELVTVSGTIGDGFTISSDNVTLDDLTITGFATGVRINAIDNLNLTDILASTNATYGINVATGPVTNLTITNGTYSGSSVGMKVASATSIDGLTINGATFSGNSQGFAWPASSSTPSNVDNVAITNTTFFQNSQKGLYIEKLSNAVFDNITIDECGTDVSYNFNAAIDLNLKYGSYSNITIKNSDITDSAYKSTGATNERTAISINPRDDGGSYSAPNDATLSGFTFENNTFDEIPGNFLYFGTILGSENNVISENDFSNLVSPNYSIISSIENDVNVLCNWHGTVDVSAIEATFIAVGSGDILLTSYSEDAAFLSCAGLIENINTMTFFPTIQSAIDDPTTLDGHTIVVKAGNYTETITISKNLTIQGANSGTAGTDARVAESVILNSAVTVTASGSVTIDGFQFLRNDAITGSVLTLGGNSQVDVMNNIFERNGSAAGTNIRAIVTSSGAGVKNISDNLITGDDSGGLFSGHVSWNNGFYINGAASSVNITDNTIENCRTAVNLDDYQAGIVLSGNTIDNNGTHIAFGGTTPTDGSYTLDANDFINNAASTMINLSNVAETFRLDISSSTLSGTLFSALPLATLFEVEARMAHKEVLATKKGKVTYVANTQYVNNFVAPAVKIDIIQNSIKYADANDVINLEEGTYKQGVVIDESMVTLQGATTDKTLYILDGTSLPANGAGAGAKSGIKINTGITDISISQLTVKNFNGVSGNVDAGIYGVGGNDNLTVDNVAILDNVGGSGFYANGPVNGVTINNCMVSGHTVAARGIVIWNGFKQNITITNNTVSNNNCCGIELQDGSASGVNISSNIVFDNSDNGIGVIGLTSGIGANIISGNLLEDNGRFGIEIKNPMGNGLDAGDGSIVVENNSVGFSLGYSLSDLRDASGIAVFRRAPVFADGNPDIPQGVIIRNNTVEGYKQSSDSDGFGIVVEGQNHTVENNTLERNDVGLQIQAGHLPYSGAGGVPDSGDQSNLDDDYFGRGNASESCNIMDNGQIYGAGPTANGVDLRSVGFTNFALENVRAVTNNAGSIFCSIQQAINASNTVANDVITVGAASYYEDVVVDKSVTINGPNVGVSPNTGMRVTEALLYPNSSESDAVFLIEADDVTIDGFTLDGDNISISTGWPGTNGADIDAYDGIAAYDPDNAISVSAMKIQNNIIKNFAYFGVDNFGYYNYNNPSTSGHLVSDNLFTDLGTYDSGVIDFWGGGVLIYNDNYTRIVDNVMTNVRMGIQTGNFHDANPGDASFQVFDNNTIQARRRGIFYNLHTGAGVAPLTISNNTITGLMNANETQWDGILASSLSDSEGVIMNNTVDGTGITNPSEGYEVWNVNPNAPVKFIGGSAANVNTGIFVNNYEGYSSNAGNTAALIDGVDLTTNITTGIHIKDSPSNTNSSTVSAEIVGNTDMTTNTTDGRGIYVEGADASANIHGNLSSITGNNIGILVDSGNAEIDSNTISNNTIGIQFQNGGTGSASINNITDNTDFGINNTTGTSIDAINNWWGDASGPSGEGAGTGDTVSIDVIFCPWLDGSAPSGLPTSEVKNITDNTVWCSIQEAIDNATAGDTIEIQPADYTEPGQILIDKDLTLQGKGKTMTTLRSNYDTASGGHSNDLSAWILTEEGTDVTIQDMTLDATGFDTYNALRFQSDGLVNNVAFNEIKHSASQYLGIAVQVQNGNVDVMNSMFTNIGRIGVHYRRGVIEPSVITGTYSNNMYVGKGDGDFLDYALDISGGTTIIVQDNEISNNTGVAASDGSTSAGILVTSYFPTPANSAPNNVTITGNSLHDNTSGIAVGFDGADVSVVTATENNIFDNDFGITSTGPMVSAPNNYWGEADGPSGSGLGTGDAVDAEVDACPYYDAPIGSGTEELVGPIENTTSGEYFCSIQEAIDDADTQADDVITIPDGTFAENITIGKGVTLQGPNAATSGCATRSDEAIITPETSGTTPITITADGVTITGFTITNPDGNYAMINSGNSDMTVTNNIITGIGVNATSGNTHSIYVSSNSAAVSDITIEDNKFSDIHAGEDDPATSNGSASAVLIGDSNTANDVTNLSISSNCIDSVRAATVPFVSGNKGGKGAYGILLGHGGSGGGQVINAQIANNDISDIEGLWAHAIGLEGNTPSADVVNNKIDDIVDHKSPTDAVAVLIEDNDGVADVLINNNSFTNVNIGIWNKEAVTVDGTCNFWDTVDDDAISDKFIGAVTVSSFLNNGTDDSPSIGFQPVAGSCVGMFPILNVTTNVFYPTIQEAIDGAVAGDTIEIQPADYAEPGQVIVDVDVRIEGKGKTMTTLRPGMNTGTSGDARAFILVNAGVDFDLADLTIDGSGRLIYQAIRQRGEGSVDNVRFTEIKYSESGPDYQGVAIAAFGTGNVDVTNSMFDEIGRIGVLYFGTGIDVSNFSNNMYTGKGVGDWLDYAIDISAGAKVNVTNNQISENHGVASSDGSASAGILVSTFFGAGTEATITGNDISDNTTGIAVGFDGADASTVTATENNIFDNDFGITSTGPLVDAPNNWWGAANGPGGTGLGLGDPVDAEVDACPFYNAMIGSGSEELVGPIENITSGEFFCTIQEAIDDAQTLAGDTIELAEGTYNERVVINKSITLTGANMDKTLSIIDGSTFGANGDGILIANGIKNVSIKNLTVQNFAGLNGNSDAGIYAVGGNNNLLVDNVALLDNVGGSGFYANGPVDTVTVTNSMISGHTANARGIVIWNGLKENITITNNIVSNNNCCGIELQDGTANNVLIKKNTVTVTTGDSGLGLTGMSNAVVDSNVVNGAGRFGIEVKNPNGAVLVTNNVVTNTGASNGRDYAGIAIFRRGVLGGASGPDLPMGVTITGNTVTGYTHVGPVAEGFGIVVEGTGHTVNGNTLEGNDIGIQFQGGGHADANYPGDGNQNAGESPAYFGRGNAQFVCGVDFGANTYNLNGIDQRLVTASENSTDLAFIQSKVSGQIHNQSQDAYHCTIQDAIDNAAANDTISVPAGIYKEDLLVHIPVTINGPNAFISPIDGVRVGEAILHPATSSPFGEIIKVVVSDVKINGLTIDGDNTALSSGYLGTNGADLDAAEAITVYVDNVENLTVENNIIQNLTYFGVTLFGASYSAPATSGHLINQNVFNDLGTYDAASGIDYWGGGVLIYNDQYTRITNNEMNNVRMGIQTGNFHKSNPGDASFQVMDNNTIEARRRGIFYNLHTGANVEPLTLSNNHITGLMHANETVWDGILAASLSDTSGIIIDNVIDGTGITNPSEGIEVWNVGAEAAVNITGDSVSNVDIGVYINTYEGYSENAGNGAHAVIDGINLTSGIGQGIYVKDSPLNTSGSLAYAEIKGNTDVMTNTTDGVGIKVEGANASADIHDNFATIEGNDIGVLIDAGAATITNNSIELNNTGIKFINGGTGNANNNNIVGNITIGIDNTTGADIDATSNWWGEADGPSGEGQGSGDAVSIDVIYCPWLDAAAPGGEVVSMIYNFTMDTYHCTIQEAVDAADDNDEIRVMSGTYDEQVLINKPISLVGTGTTKPILTCTGVATLPSGRKTQIEVTAMNVTITGFEFDLDMSKLSSAILASGSTNNLTISDNEINPRRSGPSYAESYGLRNAISINYADYRVNSSNPLVTVTNNVISFNDGGTPGDLSDDAGFRSGVSMDEGAGTFSGNDITSINHDILSRFNGAGDLTINGSNIFRGGGVQIAEHNAGAGTITVSGNTFDSPFANTYTSSLRLQNNQQDKTTTISNNIFNNHSWGISLENYSDVTIDNNVFTPVDAAAFRHITVNTKLLASNSHTIVQDEINGVFTNNTFNKAASFVGGTGIAFYNHDSDDDAIGEFTVGSAGNENSFNDGLMNFILLGDQTGDSNADANFPEYAGVGITTMACFDQNINIKDNLFDTGSGLKLPYNMVSAELLALEDLLYHQPDNSCLGELVYQLAEIMLTINGIVAQNVNNGMTDMSEDVTVIACNEDNNITFSNITGSTGNIGVLIDFTSSDNLTANGVDPDGITISATLADFNTIFIAANQPADFRLVDETMPGSTTAVLTPFNDTNKNGTIDAGECVGELINFEIQINPQPFIDNVPDQLVCNGDNTDAITFTSDVPGSTYSWTNNDPSIGLAASGMGDIPAFAAINVGDQPVTATITVTPNFDVGGEICQGSTEVFIITVLDSEEPEITCPADITLSATAGTCAAIATFDSPKAYDPQYFEGFERTTFAKNTPGDWNEFNSVISRVTSGTNGVTSKDGVAHGFIDNTINPQSGVFTRLGGYSNVFGNGFRTSQDVYLDLGDAAVLANTYGWDLSSAVNDQSGTHERDFVFHAASNAAGNILIAGSNNTNFTRRNDLASLNHYEVTTSGWYTFEHIFRDAGDGSLAVDLNLKDASGAILFTETRNNAADMIATVIGGNRYIWFTFIEAANLSIDNTSKANTLLTTCDADSGDSFPVGSTLVTCETTDGCTITGTCTFTVTVTDDEAPAFASCPIDDTACSDDGMYSWTHPELNDNCMLTGAGMTELSYTLSGATMNGPVTVTSYDGTSMATESLEVGETTVTYSGKDASGNTASNICSFVITLEARPTVQTTYAVPGMSVDADNENVLNEFDLTMCSGDTLTISEAILTGMTVDPSDCGELRVQTIYTNNISGVAVSDTVDHAEGEMWSPSILSYDNFNFDTRTVVFVSTPYYDTDGDDELSMNERRGAEYKLTLNVDPEPVAIAVSEVEACNDVMYALNFDEYITNIVDDSDDDDDDNQPIVYMWEITDIRPLPAVIGVAEGDMGTGNVMHTVSNPYTVVETIEYTVTPTSENGCVGESFIVNVDINANPQVAINTNGSAELCQGEDRSILGFAVPTGSYDYMWKIVNLDAGNASIANETTLFPELTAPTDNENDLIIRFIASNSITGCADSTEVTFTVGAVPTFTMGEPSDLEVCENIEGTLVGTFNLNNSVSTVSPMGATVTFHTSATDAENGVGALPNPGSYTATDGEVIYVRLENNGCYVTEDITLTVKPLPIIIIDPVMTQCENGGAITLTASPMGGTFSGTGITGDMFDPMVAGQGTHTITYTAGVGGCTNSGTIDIDVVETINIVTNTNDSGPGSLRAIIANPCVGDTVFFDAGLLGNTILLTSGEITISDDIVILGLGMDMLTISGNDNSRIFNVQTGVEFDIIEVSLKDGFSISEGGAIRNEGNLTLRDVILENNFESTLPKALTNLSGSTLKIQGNVEVKE